MTVACNSGGESAWRVFGTVQGRFRQAAICCAAPGTPSAPDKMQSRKESGSAPTPASGGIKRCDLQDPSILWC